MKSYLFVFTLVTFSILFLSCTELETDGQPNIVLFLVDDLGWQDTSVPFWDQVTPQNMLYHTPNMERLAAEGMKFTQAYATPVCSPSRISLMTGMNAARHRVTNWTLRRDVLQPMETGHAELSFPHWNVNGLTPDSTISNAAYATALPELLRQAGYFTVHAGKAHFAAIGTPGEDPRNIGFDINIAGHAAGAPASFYGTDNFGNIERYGETPWAVPGLEKYYGEDIFLTEAIVREALDTLQQTLRDEHPFFLYLSLYSVHTPIMADPRFVQKYYDMGIDSTEAQYASMVESMDKALGDVLNFLDTNELSENTVVLFMSDNGGLSAVARGGEEHTHNFPLKSGKGSIHEGGIREPMLVRWPGQIPAGTTNPNYLIIEDYFPTLLELAAAESFEIVQTVDGKSFVSLLDDPTQVTTTRPLYWHYPNHWGPSGPGIGAHSAVRRADWKLIYYHIDQRLELYNLVEDIGEHNDRSSQDAALTSELASLLTEHLKSVNAQMPALKSTGQQVPWPNEAFE